MQQEFTKKIGFSSLSLGGMFLADDPLIYCGCSTLTAASLAGLSHIGIETGFSQVKLLILNAAFNQNCFGLSKEVCNFFVAQRA